MKIYDKMGNKHATVEECLAAEKEYDEKVAAEKARKEELAKTRKARAEEVEQAYNEMVAAQKKYRERLNSFLADFGSYHKTISYKDNNNENLFKDLLDNFSIWF